MSFHGSKTQQIGELHEGGFSLTEIAERFEITESSVKKRLIIYKRKSEVRMPRRALKNKPKSIQTQKYTALETWSLEKVKIGFERFMQENGRLPTAYEVDDSSYLPSSRQIQRKFGGLSKLRGTLGYGDIHLGKGDYRRESTRLTGPRGRIAEDKLEILLAERFGELYVQSEKRFGGGRNRIDFVIYAKDFVVGIDVFATDEKRTIIKNVAVKVPKYKNFPADIPLYFVVWTDSISDQEIKTAVSSMKSVQDMKNLKVVGVKDLLDELSRHEPLTPPSHYKAFPHS